SAASADSDWFSPTLCYLPRLSSRGGPSAGRQRRARGNRRFAETERDRRFVDEAPHLGRQRAQRGHVTLQGRGARGELRTEPVDLSLQRALQRLDLVSDVVRLDAGAPPGLVERRLLPQEDVCGGVLRQGPPEGRVRISFGHVVLSLAPLLLE